MHIKFKHIFRKALNLRSYMDFFNIGGKDIVSKTVPVSYCRNMREVKCTLYALLQNEKANILYANYQNRYQCVGMKHPDYEGLLSYFCIDIYAREVYIDMIGDEEELKSLWIAFWEVMEVSKNTLYRIMETKFEVHNPKRSSFRIGNPWRVQMT